MRKLLFALGACALSLGLAGSAQAHGGSRVVTRERVTVSKTYYKSHARTFSGGYYYAGYRHPHWGGRVWCAEYRRYNYWDPSLRCYFYWCAPAQCWYPITYCYPG
jgi:hypothetical protein